MKDVICHYDELIKENNDPFRDPEYLKKYMEKWDGQRFFDCMGLDKTKSVLEIGIGTGRLAVKAAPLCRVLYGIDISPKTVKRAAENLSAYDNIKLICGDFMTYEFSMSFDVIYSSLTFMHIEEKFRAVKKAASLLNDGGRLVLSLDKSKDEFIDMSIRTIRIYPDNPTDTVGFMVAAGLMPTARFETEYAYVLAAEKHFQPR